MADDVHKLAKYSSEVVTLVSTPLISVPNGRVAARIANVSP